VLLVEVDNTADCENALKLDMEVLNLTLGATLIEALDDRLCGGDSFVHVYLTTGKYSSSVSLNSDTSPFSPFRTLIFPSNSSI